MGEYVMIREEADHTHKEFSGLRNNVAPGEFDLSDLEVALNVEVNDKRVVQRRKGYSSPVVGGSYHSLWAGAGVCLVATGASLVKVSADYSVATLRADLAPSRPISYHAVGARAYYSNGVDTGVVENGESRSWGLEVPPPIAATATVGSLRAGKYQFALTYIRDDEQESGASLAGTLELSASGGLSFELPVCPDQSVVSKALYVSKVDGETLFRRAVIENEVVSFTVLNQGNSTLALTTQHLGPAPSGDVISSYNGRMLSAIGSTLSYSEPYAYELFDRLGVISTESTIHMLAPVEGGVFVGTEDATVFLRGNDMGSMEYKIAADYGVIPGTISRLQTDVLGDGARNGTAYIWASKNGVCVGFDGGGIVNLTQDRFAYPTSDRGATVVRRHRGMNQAVVVLAGTEAAGNIHI
jgi:hypothetical protein